MNGSELRNAKLLNCCDLYRLFTRCGVLTKAGSLISITVCVFACLCVCVFIVLTNSKMASICPDCPVLVALNNTNGLRAVDSIVKTFNKNTSNQHYYILHEVGRILTGVQRLSLCMHMHD